MAQDGDYIVTFHRVYPAAPLPMKADSSALGIMPTAAYQYCEAMRSASAFGWYIFPPVDIYLKWNGYEILYLAPDDTWQTFVGVHFGEEFQDHWREYAPEDLKDHVPPYLTTLPVPGIVQVWSGLFIGTAPGWSVLIRPPVNLQQGGSFQCYEGMVETDEFKPVPLFVNIRLFATDHVIVMNHAVPLFQVQPISRACYAARTLKERLFDGIRPRLDDVAGMSREDWDGFRRTTRKSDVTLDEHRGGEYGAKVRRRARHDDEPS